MRGPRSGCKSSRAGTNPAAGVGVASATSTSSLVVNDGRDAEAGLWKQRLCFPGSGSHQLSSPEAGVSARGYLFPI